MATCKVDSVDFGFKVNTFLELEQEPKGYSPRLKRPPLRRRWRMLAILSANICVSYLPWYTFVPIMSQSMVVYDASAADFNMLCILYSLVYVPGVFLIGNLLASLGCHRCFMLATGCLTAGCALRCGPSVFGRAPGMVADTAIRTAAPFDVLHLASSPPPAASFLWLLLGQGLCAIGQTFLVNATSHLAAEWFPPDERPAAAMIVNLMNFIGGCLSFMVPTWYVDPVVNVETAHTQILALLVVQLKVSFFAFVVTAVFYQDVPSRRRESIAAERADVPLFSELWRVFRLRDFWLVNCQFGLYLTVLNTFDAIEGALLVNYGYSEALTSWTAVSFCVSSILSTAVESVVIKHPAVYRRVLIGINCILAVSLLLGLECLRSGRPDGCFVCVVGIMGLSTPGWGCSLEIGSEVCYPAREATVSSLLEAFGSVASIGGILIAQWLIDEGMAAVVLAAMAVGSLSGGFALLGLSGRLRRREAEDMESEPDDHDEVVIGLASASCDSTLTSSSAYRRSRASLHLV